MCLQAPEVLTGARMGLYADWSNRMVDEWLCEQPHLWDSWQAGGWMYDAYAAWQASAGRPVIPKGVFCRVMSRRFDRSVLRRGGKPTICYLIQKPVDVRDSSLRPRA